MTQGKKWYKAHQVFKIEYLSQESRQYKTFYLVDTKPGCTMYYFINTRPQTGVTQVKKDDKVHRSKVKVQRWKKLLIPRDIEKHCDVATWRLNMALLHRMWILKKWHKGWLYALRGSSCCGTANVVTKSVCNVMVCSKNRLSLDFPKADSVQSTKYTQLDFPNSCFSEIYQI